MHAILVAAGENVNVDRLLESASGEDAVVVAIDGGLYHLKSIDIVPHYIVGDFDSVDPDILDTYGDCGVKIISLENQAYTDFDKALVYTIRELGADTVEAYGWSGSRFDHACAALTAFAKYGEEADIVFIDPYSELHLVPGELILEDADLINCRLSLLPFGPVEGVTLTGVQWPLNDEPLGVNGRDGTSNIITSNPVTIKRRSGILFIQIYE